MSEKFKIPPDPEILKFKDLKILDFHDIEAPWNEVISLSFNDCKIKSFNGLPNELKNLQILHLRYCQIRSIHNLPRMPNLKRFTISNCVFRNFAGIEQIMSNSNFLKKHPSYINYIRGGLNSLISPYGIPFDALEQKEKQYLRLFRIALPHDKISTLSPQAVTLYRLLLSVLDQANSGYCDIPQSYKKYIDPNRWTLEHIIQFFSPSPSELAFTYANKISEAVNLVPHLSKFEIDRIIYEGTTETFSLLLQKVPVTDPVLNKLAKELNIVTKLGSDEKKKIIL